MPDIITSLGYLFYPLLLFSIFGLVLIIERALFFVTLPKLQSSKSFKQLSQELKDNTKLAKPLRDELISFRLGELHIKLTRGVQLLRLIAVLSPMLGLLGTVLGMIKAFKKIAANTGPVLPSTIADGLWNAMLTTAYGLIIALPCLLAAFIFARMAEKRLQSYQKQLNKQTLQIEGVKL